jgi:hypothetical protein
MVYISELNLRLLLFVYFFKFRHRHLYILYYKMGHPQAVLAASSPNSRLFSGFIRESR